MAINVISILKTILVLIVLVYIGKQALLMTGTNEALKTCSQIQNCAGILPAK